MSTSQGPDKSSERIVRLLLDLQSGQAWDPIQLAQELAVSRRTIFRDIATLRRAGVPVQFDERQNTYRLPQSRTNVPSVLSSSEIIALTLAARTSPLNAAKSLAKVIRDGTKKFTANLSAQSHAELDRLSATCVGPPPGVEALKHPACIEAVLESVRLRDRTG
jgi:predicted DNA-binding transcriptional regulator YafY